MEVLQTFLITRDAFRQFASGFCSTDQFLQMGWLWFSMAILSAIVHSTVQMFYAWRTHILSKTRWLPLIMCVLSAMQFVGGIYVGTTAHRIRTLAHLQYSGIWPICWNILARLSCDLVIVTGLLYAIFAAVDLALYIALPGTTYHLTPSIAESKLYSNSMLAVLNARILFPGGRNQPPETNNAALSFPSNIRFRGRTQTGESAGASAVTGLPLSIADNDPE